MGLEREGQLSEGLGTGAGHRGDFIFPAGFPTRPNHPCPGRGGKIRGTDGAKE
jgi:hypothetical protein